MAKKRQPLRAESGADAAGLVSAAQAPMDKFRALATRLLSVSREKLHEQQETYQAQNAANRSGRGARAAGVKTEPTDGKDNKSSNDPRRSDD